MICDGYVVTEPLCVAFIVDRLDVSPWLIFVVCTFLSTADVVGPPTVMGPRGGH